MSAKNNGQSNSLVRQTTGKRTERENAFNWSKNCQNSSQNQGASKQSQKNVKVNLAMEDCYRQKLKSLKNSNL